MSLIPSRIAISLILLLACAAFPLAGRPTVVWGQAAAQDRLVAVTGFKHAGANGVRVDLTLDVPPGADAAAIARDALARQGAQPLADSTSTSQCAALNPRWPQFFDHGRPHPVVPQYYNSAGDPTAGGALAALQSAEQAWNSVPSSRFALHYAATTTAGPAFDGINMVGWTAQPVGGLDALALTTTTFSCTTGFILDSDVLISTDVQWFTNPANLTPTSFDLRAVLLHEDGHVAGLGHSADPTAVMFPFFNPGIVGHGLAQDDINAISTRYPVHPQPLQAFSAISIGRSAFAGPQAFNAIYSGSSAFAGPQAFSAAYSGSITFTGTSSAVYTGSGTGAFVGTSQVQGTLAVLSGAVGCPGASFNTQHDDTLTAANGDSLSVAVSALACETPPGSRVYQTQGTYVITGGTGQFVGATGQGTVAGQANFPTHTFSLSYSGSIALAAAFTGFGTGAFVGTSQVQGTLAVLSGAVGCPGASFNTQHDDTLTAANGDSLSVVVSALACETPPGSRMYQTQGTYVITGGTGQFVGAIGQGTVTGQATFPTHTFSLSYSGSIALAAAFTGFGTGAFVGTSQMPGALQGRVQGTIQELPGAVGCPGTSFDTQHDDTLTAANGDSLSVVVFAVACETFPGSRVYQTHGIYYITGGTGRFSGENGQAGTVVGRDDFPTHTFILAFSGTWA